MRPTRTLLIFAALLTASCTLRPMAPAPRQGIADLPTVGNVASVATDRAPRTQSLQMDTDLLVKPSGYPLRIPFTLYLQWNDPDLVRVRIQREGISLIDVFQRGESLSILLWKVRTRFDGPIDDLRPEIAAMLPFRDLGVLRTVPLVDERLAESAPAMAIGQPPWGSKWRRHLWLTADPEEESPTWALNPLTFTAEAHAIPLAQPEGEWLLLTLDRYEETPIAPRDATRTHVLPTEFTLSQAAHPWRRIFRGERWRLEGSVRRHILDRGLEPSAYEPPPTPGWRRAPLHDFVGIPLEAIEED